MKKFIIPAIFGFFAVLIVGFIIAIGSAVRILGQDDARYYNYYE